MRFRLFLFNTMEYLVYLFAFLMIYAGLPGNPVFGQTDMEDILEGFEDQGAFTGTPEADKEEEPTGFDTPSGISLDGYFKTALRVAFAHDAPEKEKTDRRGLTTLRQEVQLDINLDFTQKWRGLVSAKGFFDFAFKINGKDEYTEETLNALESEYEFREVYLAGTLTENVDIRIGRQIVVWGKSDNIRITDVLNPMDMREPGLTDIEDLRMPVAMGKVSWYRGPFSVSAILIPEIRFNKTPPFGSDFYPGNRKMPGVADPDDEPDNMEMAISLNGVFTGWDISLYAARIFAEETCAKYTFTPSGPVPLLYHPRVNMFGAAYNQVFGNFLVKAEAACFSGLRFSNDPGVSYKRTDGLLGLEYNGFEETMVSLELANRHIHGFSPVLENPPDNSQKDSFQGVFRMERDFLNDTLKLTALASVYGTDAGDGALERCDLSYDYSDNINIRVGAIFYQSGDLFVFRNTQDNDRAFLEIKYSF